jgi:hypothetical protein
MTMIPECSLVQVCCPREAITIIDVTKVAEGTADPAACTIDSLHLENVWDVSFGEPCLRCVAGEIKHHPGMFSSSHGFSILNRKKTT